jgi:hypothetical protein
MNTIGELTKLQLEFDLVFKKFELEKHNLNIIYCITNCEHESISMISDPILIELRNLNRNLTQFLTGCRV